MISKANLQYNWLIGAQIDWLFFFLPIVFGYAVLFLVTQVEVTSSAVLMFLALQGFGLGPFHLGMSWAHFRDRQTKEHIVGSGQRKTFIYLLIAAIALLSSLAMLFTPELLAIVFLVTTVHHIVRQNAGILLLYHNKNECVPPKELEERTLNLSTLMLAFIFLARSTTASNIQQSILALIVLLIAIPFILSVVSYIVSLLKQMKEGKKINVPAFCFWVISVLFFLPFTFVETDYNKCLIAPLVIHWFQYIIVNWMLFSRRSTEVQSPKIQEVIGISAMIMLLVILSGAVAIHLAGLESPTVILLSGFIIGLTLIHYLQDAFLWRLRDPVIKKRIIPYLKPERYRI